MSESRPPLSTGDPTLDASYRRVFDNRIGFGERPAVLAVDFLNAYTDPSAPFYATGVVAAVEQSVAVYAAARRARVPVVYTRVEYDPEGRLGGAFVRKVPALKALVPGSHLAAVDDRVAPHASDVVLVKHYPSAFFGTSLASLLAVEGVDTVILTGCSTSGCVRASAVDAVSHGLRVIVPVQCVGDRHDAPHRANLFDIDSKYGDVVERTAVLRYLEGLGGEGADAAAAGRG